MRDAFLKTIRQAFDPCFRYMVLARKAASEKNRTGASLRGLIDTNHRSVVGWSFHHDTVAGIIALVVKLRPGGPFSVAQLFVGGVLPEDLVYYLYEIHNRECRNGPAPAQTGAAPLCGKGVERP